MLQGSPTPAGYILLARRVTLESAQGTIEMG